MPQILVTRRLPASVLTRLREVGELDLHDGPSPLEPAALRSRIGRTLVAVDAVGAGVGEIVFFVRGKEASFPFLPTEVPVDAGIVGIVDDIGS